MSDVAHPEIPQGRMQASTKIGPIALAALLWFAQVQGMLHGISHLGDYAVVRDQSAPASEICVPCASFAQTSGGPTSALVHAPTLPAVDETPAVVIFPLLGASPAGAYRSRAPPLAPI